ncbi:MAG: hypothetical protein JW990_22015, partial [Thermoleophilia bacterium]|nr:hypothetical protein [Thermoleophilia bacterium]
ALEVHTGMEGLMRARFSTTAAIVLCMLLVGISLTSWACDGRSAAEATTEGTAAPANGVTDRTVADIVLEYFATAAEIHMQGVVIEGIQVVTQAGQRTVSLYLVSDGTDEADGSLARLCFRATSEEGWTGELNRDWGLGLVWVHIYTTYPWGDSEHSVVDIAGQSLTTYGQASHWRGGPATTAPSVPSTATTQAPVSLTFDTRAGGLD